MSKTNVFYRAQNKDYPVVDSAKGVYIYDTKGNCYLDGASGCLVANIGYGVEEVADAMKNEAENIGYVHGSMFTNIAQEDFSSAIANSLPKELKYIYFVSGGTEANETAISMAIQYHQQVGNNKKYLIIGRRYSYHGSSFATLSAAGNTHRRRLYSPLLMPFPLIPAPYCYRCFCDKEYPKCGVACAGELEKTIIATGPENVAAFIFEPIIGTSAGACIPPEDYMAIVKQICDRHDVLMVADEVLCGYGRSGKFLAMEYWGIEPDIVTLGKGLGGGYTPLGAVVASEKIYHVYKNTWGKFHHGYTYQGNPISCAVGLAVNKFIRKNRLFEKVTPKGIYLREQLEKLASRYSIIGDIRGTGLLYGLELVKDKTEKLSFDKSEEAAEKIKSTALSEGLILYTGVGGTADIIPRDYLIIAPPFTISEKEIDQLVGILDSALNKFCRNLRA